MNNMMMKQLLGMALAGLLFAVIPTTLLAADYSTDTTPTAEGSYSDALDTKKLFSKHGIVLDVGDAVLAQNADGTYIESGAISRNVGILKGHYQYFESAMLEIEADLPSGTSIDLYVRTGDPDGSAGLHSRERTWTKVKPGEKIQLGSSTYTSNNALRWKAVLISNDDGSATPTLSAVNVTYYNANHRQLQLTLPQNVYGVNRTTGSTINVTVLGKNFQKDKEEVYLKNLLAATAVRYVDSKTLVATFPIETLSAGTYTIAVRNTETGRVGVTDVNGYRLEDMYYGTMPDPANLRLVLKWYAPEISSFSPKTVTYAAGGTITMTGKYFSYGTTVSINDVELPSASVTVVSANKITVDLTSGIITQYNFPRDTALTITLTTPDYQTVSTGGLVID